MSLFFHGLWPCLWNFVRFIFVFRLPVTSGKNPLVVLPFVDCVHSLRHFATLLFTISLNTTLFGTLLCLSLMFSFATASFVSLSANSFPLIPAHALNHCSYIFQLVFAISFSLLLISTIRNVWMLPIRRHSSVIWLPVYTVAVFPTVCMLSVYFRAVSIANCSAWLLLHLFFNMQWRILMWWPHSNIAMPAPTFWCGGHIRI